MLVLINAKKPATDGYVNEVNSYYINPYAIIAVNPSMPTKKRYVQFEDSPTSDTKLVASNGMHEISIDHAENILIIKSHREYRCTVQYCNELPPPEMYFEEYQTLPKRDSLTYVLYNVESAARWIREHKATFMLSRVHVHVDSEKREIVLVVNENCKISITEDAVL